MPLIFLAEGEGEIIIDNAGEDVEIGDLLYLTADGTWKKADNASWDAMPCRGIALDNIKDELKGRILLGGIIGRNSWNWTKGVTLYVGVNGQLTETAPTGSGVVAQAVAFVNMPNIIHFMPQVAGSSSDINVPEVGSLPPPIPSNYGKIVRLTSDGRLYFCQQP